MKFLDRFFRRRSQLAELRKESTNMRAVLDELVYLKDLSEREGKTEEYLARKATAWTRARKLLGREAYGALKPIRAIEVSFPVPVALQVEHERMLVRLVGMICDEWCRAYPERVMWPAGQGSKITYMPMTRDEERAGRHMEFDDSIYAVECCERERYLTDRG